MATIKINVDGRNATATISTLRELFSSTDKKTKDAQKSLDKYNKEMESTGKYVRNANGKLVDLNNKFVKTKISAHKASKEVGFFSDRLKSMSAIFAGGLGFYKLSSIIKTSVKDFKTLEGASLEVAKTTGLTGSSLKTLTSKLDRMSVTMNGFEIEGLYDIAAAAGQLGITGVDNIASFTKEMQYMAASSTLSAEDAATGFAQLSNVMKVPISEVNKLTGAFSGLAATTTATEGDLLNFTQRLAGAGKTLGLTNSQIIGVGATLKDVGVNFEVGGTTISKMFLKMLTDSEKFAKVSGVSLTEYAKTIKDEPIKAVNDLLNSLSQMDKGSKINALKYLKLDSAAAANTLLKLSSGMGKLTANIATADREYKKGNATLNEYLVSSTSLEQAQVKNANASMLFGRAIGSFLKPIMVDFSDKSTSVFNSLSNLIGNTSVHATEVFGQAIVDMANAGITAMKYLALSINGIIGLMNTVVGGYNKLRGFVGGGDTSEIVAQISELKALRKEGKTLTDGGFLGFGKENIRAKIKDLEELKSGVEKYNAIRVKGEKQIEEAVKTTALITDNILKTSNKLQLKNYKVPTLKNDNVKTSINLVDKLTNSVKEMGKASNVPNDAVKSQNKDLNDAQKEAKKLKDALDDTAESFASIFQQGFESILKGDFAGGLADIIGDTMSKSTSAISGAFSKGLGNMFSGAGSFLDAFKSINPIDWIGSAVSLIGGIFSTTLSEAEIKSAAGRSGDDIASKGTSELINTLEKYENKGLNVSNSMLEHLKSMDENLLSALGGAGASSQDLSGANFEGKTSGVLGGIISASSTELIGAGIQFYDQAVSGFVDGVNADGYKAIKETSTLFGIFTSESIQTELTDLGSKTSRQIGQAFQDGLDASLDGLGVLGFNVDAINAEIQNYVLSIGKINFQDMSFEEQAEALNRALTEQLNGALSGALGNVADVNNYGNLLDLAENGEEVTGTIGRLAVGFETVNSQMLAFNQSITSFTQSQALIDAAGGLDAYSSGMNTFMQEFFTDGERSAFYQQQIQNALAVYDVSLPASKAQYKALLLETQGKITSVQTSIDARKAEIRAEIAAGTYRQKSTKNYIENINSEIRAKNLAGQASIAYGDNVNKSLKAMAGEMQNATTVDTAGNIDIDWAGLGDSTLNQLQSEMDSLSGLYGTLLNSSGAYSSAMDGVASATQTAIDGLSAIEAKLLDFEKFRASLMKDDVAAAKLVLDATTNSTGLTNLTTNNILSEMSKNKDALTVVEEANTAYASSCDTAASSCDSFASSCDIAASSCGTLNTQLDEQSDATRDLLQDYKDQYAALKAYEDALEAHNKMMFDAAEYLNIWDGVDSVQLAQNRLDFIQSTNDLATQTYETFRDSYEAALENGVTADEAAQWQELGNSINTVRDELKGAIDELKSAGQEYYDLQKDSMQTLLDFGKVSTESYMASLESAVNNADFAGAKEAFDDIISSVNDNKTLTYKEKVFKVADANNTIGNFENNNPNSDIVKGLELLREENKELRKELKTSNKRLENIERNTGRTSTNTDNEYLKIVGEL